MPPMTGMPWEQVGGWSRWTSESKMLTISQSTIRLHPTPTAWLQFETKPRPARPRPTSSDRHRRKFTSPKSPTRTHPPASHSIQIHPSLPLRLDPAKSRQAPPSLHHGPRAQHAVAPPRAAWSPRPPPPSPRPPGQAPAAHPPRTQVMWRHAPSEPPPAPPRPAGCRQTRSEQQGRQGWTL